MCWPSSCSAYQDDATRELARQLGFVPVVPPSPQRRQPWEPDKALYRRRNEVEMPYLPSYNPL